MLRVRLVCIDVVAEFKLRSCVKRLVQYFRVVLLSVIVWTAACNSIVTLSALGCIKSFGWGE
jgi:hypothetical protein